MPQALSTAQRELHEKALSACAQLRRVEMEIIQVLISIEAQKIHRLLGHPSLFAYAVHALGLSEANAYAFISVARKCGECVPLRRAIEERVLSVSKAARLISALSTENAETLLEFATTHTSREIDKEVARLKPQNKARDHVRPLSPEWEQPNCAVSPEVSGLLKRAQSVLSSKLGRSADFNETLLVSLSAYLEKNDPVRKAERAQKRKQPLADESFCPGRVANEKKRVPFSASEKHAVHARDQGRCTFVDPATGKRCENDRWLHFHHVVAVAAGGGNDSDNLRTLCAAHHDLAHQLSLPIDGQVTWLREPQARYG